MNFHEAAKVGVIKQVLGWIISLLAGISTFISLLKFLSIHGEKKGPTAVVTDFIDLFTNMLQHNTQFLQLFWHYSPAPVVAGSFNVGFWLIYLLIFLGLALQGAGARMWRQSRFIKEKIEDMLIIEAAKPGGRLSKQQLTQQLRLPNHPFYRQYYRIILLPAVMVIILLVLLNFAGLLN